MKTLATDLERLIAQLPQDPEPGRVRHRKPRKRRITELNAEELAAMIADYTAGVTLKQLAAKHRYSHVGISEALKSAGGQSLARIAERLQVNPSSVRVRLLQRGVTMRLTSGRA